MSEPDLFGEHPEERVLRYLDYALPEQPDPVMLSHDVRAVRNAASCVKGDRLTKAMSGLGSLWGYFPHAFDVEVSGTSLRDKLRSTESRATLAKKTAQYCDRHERGKISFNRIRQSIKAYNGHHVSNFRPVAARDMYRLYDAKKVFDPCAGWGGRMVGAVAAGVVQYRGLDAGRLTVESHQRLIADLGMPYTVTHGAAEDATGDAWADMAFTSPPYFDAERYSHDPEQSWKRYATYPQWRDGFLRGLLRVMCDNVRSGGIVAVNIANVKRLPLENDTLDIAASIGLSHIRTMRYVLSSIAGKGEKSEPVFVFRKAHGEGAL